MTHEGKKINAFTLVELAIVIVIIGLLVSGVLAGQTLIEQAKIRAQIKQFQDFDAATITFKGKYGFLPGDMPYQRAMDIGFSSSYVAGQVNPNGDDVINDLSGSIPPRAAWPESKFFFIQLKQSKILKGDISAASAGQFFAVGVEFPPDKMGKGGIAAVSLADGGLYYFMGPSMRLNSTNNSIWSFISESPTLTAEQAQNLDEKLDDGKPSTGKFRPVQVPASAAVFTNDIPANNCVTATNEYNLSSSDLNCRIVSRSGVK